MSPQPDLLIRKLIEKLTDHDPRTRRNAAARWACMGPEHCLPFPALSALLVDNDARVRMEAERTLDHLRMVVA